MQFEDVDGPEELRQILLDEVIGENAGLPPVALEQNFEESTDIFYIQVDHDLGLLHAGTGLELVEQTFHDGQELGDLHFEEIGWDLVTPAAESISKTV